MHLQNSDSIMRQIEKKRSCMLRLTKSICAKLRTGSYEGANSFSYDLKKVYGLIRYLDHEWSHHVCLQHHLFDFIDMHIPRLKYKLKFFRLEHTDLIGKLQSLKSSLACIENSSHTSSLREMIERTRDEAAYLFCLLEHHLKLESQTIDEAIDDDLKTEEKIKIARLIEENR
jgi:hypothetical protein